MKSAMSSSRSLVTVVLIFVGSPLPDGIRQADAVLDMLPVTTPEAFLG